jgi:predicted secreted Zn-dependent protease
VPAQHISSDANEGREKRKIKEHLQQQRYICALLNAEPARCIRMQRVEPACPSPEAVKQRWKMQRAGSTSTCAA